MLKALTKKVMSQYSAQNKSDQKITQQSMSTSWHFDITIQLLKITGSQGWLWNPVFFFFPENPIYQFCMPLCSLDKITKQINKCLCVNLTDALKIWLAALWPTATRNLIKSVQIQKCAGENNHHFTRVWTASHLIVFIPGQRFCGEDKPVLLGSSLHDADVVDGQPTFPYHLRDTDKQRKSK